ncbi:MAG: CpaF family protein [Actinobacteria bacterium]|nr:CpaF family protein [Actinomycetota bacterium]
MPSLSERVAAARESDTSDVSVNRSDALGELRGRLHFKVVEELGPTLYDRGMSDAELRLRVLEMLEWAVDQEQGLPLTSADRRALLNEIASDVLGYGPIDPLLNDPEVTEVMINGPYDIYYEKSGKLYLSDIHFVDEVHLRRIIDKIVGQIGRRVDEATPMVDARLPDGSRVNAIISPLAIGGPFLTIRKFAVDPYQEADLIGFGTLTQRVADFARACVRGRLNIIISGGTGSGKTTTLNVVSAYIPDDERIVTVEDAAELQLHQEHVLTLESRPANIEGQGAIGIRELVRNTLRMRPDRIVVGEVRGAEALDMLQAMNTGHDGSLTTVHSNSPRDTLSRIETMVLMAGFDLPVRAIREQIASAVDLIIHVSRLKDGSRRVTHVTEVEGMEGEIITLQDLFLFDYGMGVDDEGVYKGRLKATGIRPSFSEDLEDQGIRLPADLFEPEPFARRKG